MRSQLHIAPSGPAPCSAERGECPYEAGGHFYDAASAESAFAESMGGLFPAADRERIELELDFGTVEVQAGDLRDPQTRFYLANGLCGDLALEIREQQGGGAVHFVVDPSMDGSALTRANENRLLGEHVAHAVVESKAHPGFFIDAYGLKSREEIEEFYAMELREVPADYLNSYGSGEDGRPGDHDLSSFAQSALAMAGERTSYPYASSGAVVSRQTE